MSAARSIPRTKVVVGVLIAAPLIATMFSADAGQAVGVVAAVAFIIYLVAVGPRGETPSVPVGEVNALALSYLEELAELAGDGGLGFEIAYGRGNAWAVREDGTPVVYFGASELGDAVFETGAVNTSKLLFIGGHEIAHHALGHTKIHWWRIGCYLSAVVLAAGILPDTPVVLAALAGLVVAGPVWFVLGHRRDEYAADKLGAELVGTFLSNHPEVFPEANPGEGVVIAGAVALGGYYSNPVWSLHPASSKRLSRIGSTARAMASA